MEIKKSSRLNGVSYDIRGPVTTLALQMEQRGTKIIKLNTGNPAAFGFIPFYENGFFEEQVQTTAAYSDSKGMLAAREAIAEYEGSKGIKNIQIENVFTGNGVSELISITLQALLDVGDEILIPAPDYPLWTAAARLAGGKVVHYFCHEENDWMPDIEDMSRKVTSRTKAIVVINPNNPTGAVYPKKILRMICTLAERHNLLIFSDEIYDRLLMDNKKHVAIASLAPHLPIVTMNGLSKSHQLCGFRAGWMVFSGDLSGAKDYLDALNVLVSMRLCSNVNAQAIIAPALKQPNFSQKEILPGGRLYEQREITYSKLQEIDGISVVKSRAGLYMFPKLDIAKFNITDDNQFVLDFLREKHVLLTHGSGYHWHTPDHFRMVYLPTVDELAEVMARLKDFLANYWQS